MFDNNKMITNGINSGNQPLNVKWDPKNLEIRTHSVEKTLEPLVMQVCLIVLKYNNFNLFFFQLTR